MFKEVGADGFLGKPLDREKLQQVLLSYLQLERQERGALYNEASLNRVLVVDDEQNILDLYQLIFENESLIPTGVLSGLLGDDEQNGGDEIRVSTARQGETAVEIARKAKEEGEPFPVAFIDMRMPPGMDGLATAQALRELDDRIYIVIVTAYTDVTTEEIYSRLGYGVLYINKPFETSEIERTTRMLLENWKQDRLQGEQGHTVQSQQANAIPNTVSESDRKVLIVDDDPGIQQLIKDLLERKGIAVSAASSGEEALQLALTEHFDLILMDMQMPDMDGVETTKNLRSLGCDTPISALTANVMKIHQDRFDEAGADDFIAKPIQRRQLNGVLARYLNDAISGVQEIAKDEELISDELRVIFFQRVAEQRDALVTLLERESWNEVRDIAHNLKGSGLLFGFPELSEQGAQVCEAIDLEQMDVVPTLAATFHEALSQVKAE